MGGGGGLKGLIKTDRFHTNTLSLKVHKNMTGGCFSKDPINVTSLKLGAYSRSGLRLVRNNGALLEL